MYLEQRSIAGGALKSCLDGNTLAIHVNAFFQRFFIPLFGSFSSFDIDSRHSRLHPPGR